LSHTIFVTHHLSHSTYGTGLALVARLGALGRAWLPVTPLNFAWQVWHLATSTLGFAWQVWHLVTSTLVLGGRRGTYGTGLALVARLGALGRG